VLLCVVDTHREIQTQSETENIEQNIIEEEKDKTLPQPTNIEKSVISKLHAIDKGKKKLFALNKVSEKT
jgi:hypothetical protein